MGIGNFYSENAQTIYIDHEAIYGEYLFEESRFELLEDETDSEFYYEDLIEELRSLLPPNYDLDVRSCSSDAGTVIAENRFYKITILDYHTYFAVSVVLQDDYSFENCVHPLAQANHAKAAISFFDKISELYPDHVRQRCCAWTSGLYTHSKKAA